MITPVSLAWDSYNTMRGHSSSVHIIIAVGFPRGYNYSKSFNVLSHYIISMSSIDQLLLMCFKFEECNDLVFFTYFLLKCGYSSYLVSCVLAIVYFPRNNSHVDSTHLKCVFLWSKLLRSGNLLPINHRVYYFHYI